MLFFCFRSRLNYKKNATFNKKNFEGNVFLIEKFFGGSVLRPKLEMPGDEKSHKNSFRKKSLILKKFIFLSLPHSPPLFIPLTYDSMFILQI